MSQDNLNSNNDFIKNVSVIFEENFLHLITKSSEVEKCLILSTNYCLNYFYK
jgi:hypothetical protein